MVGYQRFRGPC